jgi:hypothetical protein
MSEVTLRLAGDSDGEAIRSLAMLDDRRPPPVPVLLACRDGRLLAALSLATGDAVADPFQRTEELIQLLRCHAAGARLPVGSLPQTPAPVLVS